jgi:hypothetical protein
MASRPTSPSYLEPALPTQTTLQRSALGVSSSRIISTKRGASSGRRTRALVRVPPRLYLAGGDRRSETLHGLNVVLTRHVPYRLSTRLVFFGPPDTARRRGGSARLTQNIEPLHKGLAGVRIDL